MRFIRSRRGACGLRPARAKWALCALAPLVLLITLPAASGAEPAATADVCAWSDTSKTPEQRASLLLAASSLDQKLRWLDEQSANNPTQTVFNIGGGLTVTMPVQVPCTPVIQYTDGPAAVSGAGPGMTAFPGQTALSATWDTDLARRKGKAQGYEAFHKHRNVILGPGLASGRDPRSGRTSEYLGEDPVLAGTIAGAVIRGFGDNPNEPVESVIKHYVANEQEIDRQRSSSNVDQRTLREIYTLPFEIAIREGDPGGVMCPFNQVNGVYGCENANILRQILKTEIGFKGWVVTDFGSVHSFASTPPSLIAGMDQELNRWRFWNPDALKAALAAGTISELDIDNAAFRVVRAHIKAGLFDVPLDPALASNAAQQAAVVTTPETKAVAQEVAEKGAVLLKNNGALPLSLSGKSIAVIGPTASNTPTRVPNTFDPERSGATINLSAASVCAYTAPGVPCIPTAPLDSITARAAVNGNTVVFNNGSDLASAAAAAAAADAAVVFGYYREGEFTDRPHISLDAVGPALSTPPPSPVPAAVTGDELIAAVAAANPNTIVVLQTGGPVVMPWIGSVKAVLEVWHAGQEMGPAIASLLWGDVNPSGKVTHTFPKSVADLPTAGSPRQYPGVFADGSTTRPPGSTEIRQVDYTEGLKVGYRWYDSQGIAPLFPFGHGLSYTKFKYDDLDVDADLRAKRDRTGKERGKGHDDDGDLRVEFELRNTGKRAGTEVAQVYVGLPSSTGEPPKRLIGWARVTLNPGRSKEVKITFDRETIAEQHLLSYWDTGSESWVTAKGRYTLYVGTSAGDLLLRETFKVK